MLSSAKKAMALLDVAPRNLADGALLAPTALKASTWQSLFLADGPWFCVVAVGALAVGIAGDQLFRQPPLGLHYQTATQRMLASQSLINVVSLEEVGALLTRPDVIIVDARPHIFYEVGHLPRAKSLSREQFDMDFALLEPALRAPGHTLLIYCSDASCEDGPLVARALQQRGFGSLLLFPGGVAEWEVAGKPLEAAP